MEGGIKVTGQAEVISAINKVRDFDVKAGATRAAAALVPAVAAGTRVYSGTLAAGWRAENGAFVNTVPYAVVQEFGSIYVEPTNAIQHAWDAGFQVITDAFAAEIESAAAEAGFDT